MPYCVKVNEADTELLKYSFNENIAMYELFCTIICMIEGIHTFYKVNFIMYSSQY